jgi:hypothetical protein
MKWCFKQGDKVKFISATEDQIRWRSFNDPRKVLVKDKIYEIESVEVHHWYTKIKLVNVEGYFNSVHFVLALTD